MLTKKFETDFYLTSEKYHSLLAKQHHLENNIPKELNLKSASKNGIIKGYFRDGMLSNTGRYNDGEKTGEWKYYLRNGQLMASCYKQADLKEIKSRGYGKGIHPNGSYMILALPGWIKKLVNGKFLM